MEVPMMTFIILTVLFIIAVIIFHYCAIKRGPKAIVLSKGIASLIFVVIAALGIFTGPEAVHSNLAHDLLVCQGASRQLHSTNCVLAMTQMLNLCLFIGLICGFFGDILLALRNVFSAKKNLYIILGIIAFALGHIFYSILTFNLYSSELAEFDSGKVLMLALPFVLSAVCAGLILKISPKMNIDFGKLKPGVAIYTFVIFVFITSALLGCIMTSINSNALSAFALMLPVLLFASSDFMLSQNYFDKENKHNEPKHIIAIHVTYYLAQYIFASMIYFSQQLV